jgi:hypothetical protein
MITVRILPEIESYVCFAPFIVPASLKYVIMSDHNSVPVRHFLK